MNELFQTEKLSSLYLSLAWSIQYLAEATDYPSLRNAASAISDYSRLVTLVAFLEAQAGPDDMNAVVDIILELQGTENALEEAWALNAFRAPLTDPSAVMEHPANLRRTGGLAVEDWLAYKAAEADVAASQLLLESCRLGIINDIFKGERVTV